MASEGRRNWQCLWDLPHIFKKHQSGDPIHIQMDKIHLLPTGSEEREVLVVGSIPVAIRPSCHIGISYMSLL